MYIGATIGREAHSTSRAWANVWKNGARLTHHEAFTKVFLSEYGDSHAFWADCLFKVENGDRIAWKAVAISGPRGSNRTKQDLLLIVDDNAETYETEELGYPGKEAGLKGKLRLVEDRIEAAKNKHEELKGEL